MLELSEISHLTNDVPRLADFYKALLDVDNHSEDPVHQFILEGPLSLTVYHDGTSKNNQNENITLAFTVDDIEAAHQKVLALGAPIVEPPTQRPWGAVNMSFRDPDGNVVYLRSFPKNR